MKTIRILAGVTMLALVAHPAGAQVRVIAAGAVPADTKDMSGLTEVLPGAKPGDAGFAHNTLGGFGSGLAWTGQGNRYVCVPDRGPIDGGTAYRTRMHEIEIVFTRQTIAKSGFGAAQARPLATHLLSDEKGRPLVGSAGAFDAKDPSASTRFDPEGIRVSASGQSVYICEEYGPDLAEFSLDGKLIRRFEVPGALRCMAPAVIEKGEMPPLNPSGRAPNRGFEGLGITPDGSTLFAAMQSPLIQDHAFDEKGKRLGVNVRIVRFDVATGKATGQFVYTLDSAKTSISEVLCVNSTRLLVLERDSEGGFDAQFKKVILVDTAGATDVSGIETLPASGLPDGVVGLAKATFIDILASRHNLGGPDFPAKIESMSFGPDVSSLEEENRHTLILLSDNDFKPEQFTVVLVFGFYEGDLPGYEPQRIAQGAPPPKAPGDNATP